MIIQPLVCASVFTPLPHTNEFWVHWTVQTRINRKLEISKIDLLSSMRKSVWWRMMFLKFQVILTFNPWLFSLLPTQWLSNFTPNTLREVLLSVNITPLFCQVSRPCGGSMIQVSDVCQQWQNPSLLEPFRFSWVADTSLMCSFPVWSV